MKEKLCPFRDKLCPGEALQRGKLPRRRDGFARRGGKNANFAENSRRGGNAAKTGKSGLHNGITESPLQRVINIFNRLFNIRFLLTVQAFQPFGPPKGKNRQVGFPPL